jgi:hypothetical protein
VKLTDKPRAVKLADKGDWLGGTLVLCSDPAGSPEMGAAGDLTPLPTQQQREQQRQEQQRQRARPVVRASSAQRGGARLSPRDALIGGRPVHTGLRPPRVALSQQDVYYMLTQSNFDPVASERASKARDVAASRVAARQAAERRTAREAETALRSQEALSYAIERHRLLQLFGLQEFQNARPAAPVAHTPGPSAASATRAAAGEAPSAFAVPHEVSGRARVSIVPHAHGVTAVVNATEP